MGTGEEARARGENTRREGRGIREKERTMQGLQQQIAAQAVEQNFRAIASKIEDHLDDEMHKLDNMNEEEFDRLREQRLGALKKQQKKRQEWLRKGHGEY